MDFHVTLNRINFADVLLSAMSIEEAPLVKIERRSVALLLKRVQENR